ncbi:Holliday junction resolvase RuvX [bacterium]|nr:Holliday junction resolvase RuvX [bacterium]
MRLIKVKLRNTFSRILAIDWGTRRIGVAISDRSGTLASPLVTLNASDKLLIDKIRDIIIDEEIDRIIVGLPLNMDGSEGKSSIAAREFGVRLNELEIPIEMRDERLSSWSAENLLRESGKKPSKDKARVDRAAAAIFLQGYLDELNLQD